MEKEKIEFTCSKCKCSMKVVAEDLKVSGCLFCGFNAEALKESDKSKKQILKG